MATRIAPIEDHATEVEFRALAAELEQALTDERRAQRALLTAIERARSEGERQQRALNA